MALDGAHCELNTRPADKSNEMAIESAWHGRCNRGSSKRDGAAEKKARMTEPISEPMVGGFVV